MTTFHDRLAGLRGSLLRHPRRWALGVAVVAAVLIAVSLIRFAATVDALRARRATGPSWAFPSRVYTAGVPFVPGRPLPLPYLRGQLALRGYRQAESAQRPGTWAEERRGLEIHLRGFHDAPDPAGHGGPERIRLEIRNGILTGVVHIDGARPEGENPPRLEPVVAAVLMDEHRIRRSWVPLSRIPKVVRDAVVATEDRRFYRHLGLDLRSNLRALLVNLRARGVREGGSTITQQLARGLFL